ncbi:MAG: MogA/MoaB family molybdenum cofactor biosynthesis protein [Magnetococcales bacterium]|nr:MogA/MoaB family molybdenum cofactor biosynthesis protein [Magnetococcales bacterium]
MWQGLRLGILTLSDSRSASTDQSGQTLFQLAGQWGGEVVVRQVIPDNQSDIQQLLVDWVDRLQLDLILTTGGTGPGPRDVTPEATRAVCQREMPGFAEQIRSSGLQQTRNALFTRGVAAFRGTTLIVNLPGSTRGASHSLKAIADLVPHALRMAKGGGHH